MRRRQRYLQYSKIKLKNAWYEYILTYAKNNNVEPKALDEIIINIYYMVRLLLILILVIVSSCVKES